MSRNVSYMDDRPGLYENITFNYTAIRLNQPKINYPCKVVIELPSIGKNNHNKIDNHNAHD